VPSKWAIQSLEDVRCYKDSIVFDNGTKIAMREDTDGSFVMPDGSKVSPLTECVPIESTLTLENFKCQHGMLDEIVLPPQVGLARSSAALNPKKPKVVGRSMSAKKARQQRKAVVRDGAVVSHVDRRNFHVLEPVEVYIDRKDDRKSFLLIPPSCSDGETWKLLYRAADKARTVWKEERMFDLGASDHPCAEGLPEDGSRHAQTASVLE